MQENQEQHQLSNQAKNESLFILSSAIHAKHGVYNTQERLNQTLESLKSIRDRVNADIIVLDGGTKDLDLNERDQLKDYIDSFYSFVNEPSVKDIQNSTNWDIVKNLIEIIMFGSFFDAHKEQLKSYKRIFKMSGRYVLNDAFEIDTHLNAKDMIVIRGPFTSQFSEEVTGGVRLQYMSRLWSFDSSLSDHVADAYKNMFAHMIQRLNAGGYIDIEHLLFHHLNSDLIQTVPQIGIQGNIAPNGNGVSD